MPSSWRPADKQFSQLQPRRARRIELRRVILAMVAAASVLAVVGASGTAGASTNGNITGPPGLSNTVNTIENLPLYRHSDWGISVLDEKSGQAVVTQNAQKMFDPGSTMKLYSVSTALRLYGPNYQFKTPVYREGTVAGDTLNGNLVLVASGDMSLGLREQPNGTLYYESLPKIDQSYADIGVPGDYVEPPGNPLAGLDQLAAMVRASGITQVNGNVVIDDRLFTAYSGFPDGLIAPIWVNENLIDVVVTPSTVGQTASINWRPMTASYTVESQVSTVAAGQSTSVMITEPTPGNLVVTGQIAAGTTPTLVVREVDDPSAFARTAFIQALQSAGVSVSAPATGPNPEALLPPKGSYQPSDMIGEHVSAKLSQFSNLILKTSYNRGADLMVCLSAVRAGSTSCPQGLVPEVKTITGLGVPSTSVFPFDGAGSDDQGRTTAAAIATFLRRATTTSYGPTLYNSLPDFDRSGTIAGVLPKSPAAGHAQVKTGNRIVQTPANQILVLGNSLAGYIHTKSGRHLTFMIVVGNVPISSPQEFETITRQQAQMVAAIRQDM
ncbi:MAG TPA: D-alanyl-D-alanine carboxypeptidase/D-alanyl-D-alanine-endopeptidase [Acidimicrobiales bacterium]